MSTIPLAGLRPLLLLLVAAPVWAQAPPPEATAPPPPRRPTSLYADLKAYQAGDLLTVILAERTSARRASATDAAESAQVGGGASVPSVGGVFDLSAQVAGRRASDNQTVQSDLLVGTMTAQVVGVDVAGNLQIEGQRRLNVDGAVHLMHVRGLVRPADVSTANTVLSHLIANADVEYRQEGRGPSFLRPRRLVLAGLAAVLVGAVLVGSN